MNRGQIAMNNPPARSTVRLTIVHAVYVVCLSIILYRAPSVLVYRNQWGEKMLHQLMLLKCDLEQLWRASFYRSRS